MVIVMPIPFHRRRVTADSIDYQAIIDEEKRKAAEEQERMAKVIRERERPKKQESL